ncbi:MAG: VTT domain-containing protein [Candidatus Kerfeldbacteria bacterium]|nr:VTT domain-containing protein [Candidatus Kerfeldbacteria bacterium]
MDLKEFLIAAGYLGLFSIIFAESGLLFGVIFPGDSLLFTAGWLASQGIFDITALVLGCFIAAVLGDNVGYTFGYRVGRRLFDNDDSFFFRRDNLVRAEKFYEQHGGKALILARFIPAIRTLAPIVAGIGQMRYRTFLIYNVTGGLLWAVGITLLGYYLGSSVPGVDRYLIPIIGLVIVISVIPPFWQIIKNPQRRRSALGVVARYWNNFGQGKRRGNGLDD